VELLHNIDQDFFDGLPCEYPAIAAMLIVWFLVLVDTVTLAGIAIMTNVSP
jgi:hypothetical protein